MDVPSRQYRFEVSGINEMCGNCFWADRLCHSILSDYLQSIIVAIQFAHPSQDLHRRIDTNWFGVWSSQGGQLVRTWNLGYVRCVFRQSSRFASHSHRLWFWGSSTKTWFPVIRLRRGEIRCHIYRQWNFFGTDCFLIHFFSFVMMMRNNVLWLNRWNWHRNSVNSICPHRGNNFQISGTHIRLLKKSIPKRR